MTNPIHEAVEPLRADAIKSAIDYHKNIVEKVREELAKHGNDINAAAPYPDYFQSKGLTRLDYEGKKQRYQLFHSLIKVVKTTYRPKDPCYVEIDPQRVDKFLKDAADYASAQYDAFEAKLIHKIGDTKKAVLEGNHVWGRSFLTVEKPDGEIELWKTQQIWNVSKLGKHFPQWPSRKLKSKGLTLKKTLNDFFKG